MRLEIHPEHPEPRKIRRAVDALEAGEVIALPTDTVYGLACDSFNKKAVERVYEIKRMERSHPLAFVCPDLGEIARYAVVENHVYRILRRLLPGPYCFILLARRDMPKQLQSKRKTVGIRVPDHPVTQAVVKELGRPLIISSAAWPTPEDFLLDPDLIDDSFKGLALVLDAGAGGIVPSSVIDLSQDKPEVLREGMGSVDEFLE